MFLEKELEGHKMLEMEKMEEQNRVMKRMQRRLRDEELRILRGEQAMPGGRGEKAGGGKKELGMHKKFRLGLQGDPDSDDEDDGIDISRVGRGFDDDDDLADDNVSISDDDEEYGDNIDNDDDDDDNDGDLRRHDARPFAGRQRTAHRCGRSPLAANGERPARRAAARPNAAQECRES